VNTRNPTMPAKPSDDIARFLSTLDYSASDRERIKDGRHTYKRVRAMLIREQAPVTSDRAEG
jgi:hypothetical protein